jgi:pyruvate dehydrogenase E2 component (dihydrolipoamide acetyltransferase)
MNRTITMPALSDTMNEGRLVKWAKKIGDPIKKGESVAEVETDKAVMEVEAFHDGYLVGPLAPEGSEMRVGATIGYIADSPNAAAQATAGATPPLDAAAAPSTQDLAPSTSPGAPPAQPRPPAPSFARPLEPAVERVRASPYARKLAQALGVDVTQVKSEQGEVHADVILNAARHSPRPDLDAGPPYRVERPSSVREAVARNMMGSLATPTFRVTARLPLLPLTAVSKDAGMSLTLLLARACALTVKAHSLFNAVYTPNGLALRERVDIGIAVDTPDGLIAPVIRDVAARPLAELAADWRGAREKAASRRLSTQDYQGATFYLSNLGMFSVVHSFDAVLPLGAAAILCVAAADGERTSFTLGCDHRVLAGADAARFLQTLAEWLANPRKLTELL